MSLKIKNRLDHISQPRNYLNRSLFWLVKNIVVNKIALGRGGFTLPRAPKGAPTLMNNTFCCE